MEEQDEEGAFTPPLEQGIGGVERRGLVDIVRQQDDTPAAAIAIGGLAINRKGISAGRARRRTAVKGQTWWQFIQT